MDADLLTLKWAEGKDLHQRPSSFYGSIKAFRESLQLLLDDDKCALELCYFMHRSKQSTSMIVKDWMICYVNTQQILPVF